jgi:CheY-like chemotaxis protein
MNEPSTPKRILIVEDNTDAADSLVQLLEIYGHEAKAAYTAQQALQLIKTFPADIALLDIGLPDMSGYDLATEIRRFNQKIILIALTGYTQDVARAQAAGFNQHITKPVMLDKLQELINNDTAHNSYN